MRPTDKKEPSQWVRPLKNPTEARIIGICDPHFSPHNPTSYKADYWPILKESLRQVFNFALTQQADAIIWGGDLFHLKSAARYSMGFMAEVAALFHQMKLEEIPQVGIAGNHDLRFGSLEGIHGQPIELLTNAGLYTILDQTELLLHGDNLSVRLAGSSYLHGLAEPTRNKIKQGATHLLATGHFWFGTQTGDLFGEKIYSPEFFDQSEADILLIGHHHEDQGTHRVYNRWYLAAGSITRTGSHANDLIRRPAATYIQITKNETKITVLRPKAPAGDEIIDLEKREQQKKEEREMNEFVESLRAANLQGLDPKLLLEQAKTTDQVKDRAKHYLDKAENQ